MSVDEIITRILSAGALLGGIAALVGAWRSRRAGVRSDEREARVAEADQRRDTIADRDSLIEGLREDVHDLRERMDQVEKDLRIEREYSRRLQDFIYRKGHVPPQRHVSAGS